MGLQVCSLENIPESSNRDYFIYLLDYGWDEPIRKVLKENFDNMAKISAKNKAVIIKGTELGDFENEVFSYHQINNERGDDILPALLITNKHPKYFKENNKGFRSSRGFYRESKDDDMKLILIPFKKICKTTTEVISLIENIFQDIINQNDLSNFKITKELKKGVGRAIVDAIILEPNFSGIGFSFNKMRDYLNR